MNKIYAFPGGVPGGWSRERKIHFIAHSQGAQTVRYLQFLLKIDYFNDGTRPREDRSDWIASLTSISGCLNGALAGHSLELNPKTSLPNEFSSDFKRLLSPVIWFGLMGFSVLHNLI